MSTQPVAERSPTPTPGSPSRPRLPYLGGLDGLRALAVVAVLLYHLELTDGRAAGGYLGVEVFFVVSGYLITGLLLDEERRNGRVSLTGFWGRRARRLLPAVVTLIVAVCLYGALFARPDLAMFRGDAVASLLYVENWYAIFTDQPYFAGFGRPSPLRHLWSLAIEEQFYLVWPVLVVGAVRFLPRRTWVPLALGAAAVSAWEMAALADVDSLERAYYGTDTRAFSLLVGAALAVVWVPRRRFVDHRGRHSPWMIDAVAVAALAALVWQLDRRSEYDPWTFPWGFIWVDLLTVALIVACATTGSKVAKALSIGVLVAIGRRSYSLYLWHWPVFAFTRPGVDIGLTGWPAQVLRLGLTCGLAELSYRFVERPFRDGRAQVWIARTRRRLSTEPRRPVLLGAGAVLVGALVMTVVTARPTPDGSVAVRSPPPPMGGSTGLATPVPPPVTGPREPAAVPPVTVFGDSVMVGAEPGLEHRFADMDIDADVGRSVTDTVREVERRADAGDLRPTVVVQVGNNGAVPNGSLGRILDAVGDARLVLVNVSVPRRWESQVNGAMREFADEHPEVVLVDWAAAADRPGLKVDDGVHLTGEGIDLYSDLIVAAVRDGVDQPRG